MLIKDLLKKVQSLIKYSFQHSEPYPNLVTDADFVQEDGEDTEFIMPEMEEEETNSESTTYMERHKQTMKCLKEIEQREAERERKIKEKKLQKEQDAQRKREEKAAHAEDIRRKKLMMEEEKKQKGKEKIFSLKKSEKTKKTKLKDMRTQLAE